MEFKEKITELRKQRGLTQAEVARAIYVSRTAVSKWESGRGYPSIDSLKALAALFSVSVDELLSTEQMLTVAEENQRLSKLRFCDVIFGFLDTAMALLLFLPLFAERVGAQIDSVSLIALDTPRLYIKIVYIVLIALIAAFGILMLALQTFESPVWIKYKFRVSTLLSVLATLIFILTLQPYVAIICLIMPVLKAFILVKQL